MLLTSPLAVLAASTTTNSLPHNPRSPFVIKERHPVPPQWIEDGPARKSDVIDLQIGLRRRTENAVESHLGEISNPKHHRYGQHLSASDVRELIGPSDETLSHVQGWLREHGILDDEQGFSAGRDWLTVSVPIGKAGEMLDTTYSTFKHSDGSTLVRAPEWSLPSHLHEHIDVVQPTTNFMRPRANIAIPWDGRPEAESDEKAKRQLGEVSDEESAALIDELCVKRKPNASKAHRQSAFIRDVKLTEGGFIKPDCLRALYGTLNYTIQAADKNSVAHVNFLNQTSYRKDIKTFLQRFRPDALPVVDTFPITVVANADDDQSPYTQEQIDSAKNAEATLDSETVLSMTYPTPFEAINVGGKPPFKKDRSTYSNDNEPYLTFLNYLLERDEVPNVISISYGENEQTVPESYARRVCSAFAQLGARGVTVLASSGDFGVGSAPFCVSNDGTKTRKFLPHFPASCPWVTAVGGVKGINPEVAAESFSTGAGFSDYFPAPEYQKETVEAYIEGLGDPAIDGLYNTAGRGYPDVAAQSEDIATVWVDAVEGARGTSAATPIFASVIALVNDALIAKGKPALGFINPWLYGGAFKALNDVVEGNAGGCRTDGFPAKAGWDAVAGFGTPNFRKLVDAAFESAGGYGG